MKKGYWLLIFVATVVGFIGLFLVYKTFFVPIGIDIDKKRYPVTGIDISEHTGEIDFKKLKAQNIDFAYVKATEGGDYTDKKFYLNYKGFKAQAIPVGAYHFFRFNKSGKEQAANFLSTIDQRRFELPLVLDVEEWGNTGQSKKEQVHNEIAVFIDEVERNTSDEILIYTNESGFKKYISGRFDDKDIWICSFNNPPNIPVKWLFWQHSHKGKVDGAQGFVDINTFNGSRAEWMDFLEY
jgi:lysozyme